MTCISQPWVDLCTSYWSECAKLFLCFVVYAAVESGAAV